MTAARKVQWDFLIHRHQRATYRNAGIRDLESRGNDGCFIDRREFVEGRGGDSSLLASASLRRPNGVTISYHILSLANDEGMEAIIAAEGMAPLPETIVMGIIGRPIGDLLASGDPVADAATITSCDQNDVRLRITTRADPVRWMDQDD